MEISIDFDSKDFKKKPYMWKKTFDDSYLKSYYDSSLYLEFNWLWFQIILNIPYRKGE